MAKETILKLNRGASYNPLNLNSNGCVLRSAWSPRVAKRRVSQFGGLLFENVVETIPLRIDAASGALALEKLEDILAALEQANAWTFGAIVDPVLLEYKPHGSSLTSPVQAAILDTSLDVEDYLSLQPSFDTLLQAYSIEFDLPLKRRGLWLGVAETPASIGPIANPGALSITFTNNLRIPSPVKTVFVQSAAISGQNYGYIFFADEANKLVLIEGENMTTGGANWTDLADATASNNLVARNSGTGIEDYTLSQTGVSFNSSARLIAVYAMMDDLGSGVNWTVKAQINTNGNNTVATRPLSIATGYERKMTFFGMVAIPAALDGVTLTFTPDVTATHDIQIDYVVLLAVDEYTKAIALHKISTSVGATFDDLTIDDLSLSRPKPVIYNDDTVSGNDKYIDHSGDILINSIGTNLTARICACRTALTAWTIQDASDSALFTLTATRQKGYLVVR